MGLFGLDTLLENIYFWKYFGWKHVTSLTRGPNWRFVDQTNHNDDDNRTDDDGTDDDNSAEEMGDDYDARGQMMMIMTSMGRIMMITTRGMMRMTGQMKMSIGQMMIMMTTRQMMRTTGQKMMTIGRMMTTMTTGQMMMTMRRRMIMMTTQHIMRPTRRMVTMMMTRRRTEYNDVTLPTQGSNWPDWKV